MPNIADDHRRRMPLRTGAGNDDGPAVIRVEVAENGVSVLDESAASNVDDVVSWGCCSYFQVGRIDPIGIRAFDVDRTEAEALRPHCDIEVWRNVFDHAAAG